jgi:sporulation protein YlmC with PRC-barrel domain
MPTLDDVRMWRGKTMIDSDGDMIGTIEDVYVDRHTGRPAWAAVRTGVLGVKQTFVPIIDAEETPDEDVRVPYDKDAVKDAPQIDPKAELSHDEEREIWRHYGLTDYDDWKGEDRTTARDLPDEDRAGAGAGATEARGGPAGDAAPAAIVRLRRLAIDAPADAEDGHGPGRGRREAGGRRRTIGLAALVAGAAAAVIAWLLGRRS